MADPISTEIVDDVQHGVYGQPFDPANLIRIKSQEGTTDLAPRYASRAAIDKAIADTHKNAQSLKPLTDYPVVYNSYAGTDIVATILVPNEKTDLTLGELQTISYSIHRENTPVRTLGSVNPAGFVKGPRTIAGSLIFTQFDEYAFYRLQQYKEMMRHNLFPLADMLPPFDVILTFSNEMGLVSKFKIYGVTIVDEGGTMSVDDLVSEQTYTYMARGIQPLINYTPETFERWHNAPNQFTYTSSNMITFRG